MLTYLITGLATGEIKWGKKEDATKEEASIQYEEIIAGDLMVINSKAFILFHPQTTDVNFSKYIVYHYLSKVN